MPCLSEPATAIPTSFDLRPNYSVRWDASSVASGIYYAKFTVTDGLGNVHYSKVNKLLLTK